MNIIRILGLSACSALFAGAILAGVNGQAQASSAVSAGDTNDLFGESDFSIPCKGDESPGAQCHLAVLDAHPTQFALGYREVNAKAIQLAGYSRDELAKYVTKHVAPAVIGPDHRFYITDRHHLALSLDKIGQKHLAISVSANWSNLSEEDFWQKMKVKHWCYLNDQNDETQDAARLPRTVRDLKDDPYRSIVWALEQSNDILGSDIPFYEFQWGHFFRTQGLAVDDTSDSGFDAATDAARPLAHSRLARDLPGYPGSSSR